jgi:hypothetical protein
VGKKKRLRQAEKANYAMETGYYFQALNIFDLANGENPHRAPTPVSAGVKRAAARLAAARKATAKRLAKAEPGIVSRQRARSHAIRGR